MDRITQRTWARAIGAATLGWVGLALGRSRRMAEVVGTSESEIRALGVRDAGSAVLLLGAADPRVALAVRAGFDLTDAARYGRGRPAILAMTLGFAAVGAAGLFLRRG